MHLLIVIESPTINFKFLFQFKIGVRDQYPFQIMSAEELGGANGLSIPLGISLSI